MSKTKTLKVKQIATGTSKHHQDGVLFAVAEDGSVWRYDGDEWAELPSIEVDEEVGEYESGED